MALGRKVRNRITEYLKKATEDELKSLGLVWFETIYSGCVIMGNELGKDLFIVPGNIRYLATPNRNHNKSLNGRDIVEQRNIWARENYMRYCRRLKEILPQIEENI